MFSAKEYTLRGSHTERNVENEGYQQGFIGSIKALCDSIEPFE